MAVVIRHVQSFVRQAILGIRFSWQLAETVIDEVLEEVDAAFGALVERWVAREGEGDEWRRLRTAEGKRLKTMGGAADRDLAFVHDEVVKRLQRRQYKAGWQIQARLRVIPEVWSVLQPEFIAAGADVVIQGDKAFVSFIDVDVVSRVFEEDRLIVGGSKFVAVHGVFVRLFSPPDENPSSAVIFDVDHPFLLTYTASKCELTVKCQFEHVGVNGLVVV